MLSTLCQSRLMRGCIEILADAMRYILVMVVVFVLLGHLATCAL